MPLDESSRAREIGSRVLFELNVLGVNRRPASFRQRSCESPVWSAGRQLKSGSATINWRSSLRPWFFARVHGN
jgi:hypothetical protein